MARLGRVLGRARTDIRTIATDGIAAVLDCISPAPGIHKQVAPTNEEQDFWCCSCHPIYLRIISITAPIDLLSLCHIQEEEGQRPSILCTATLRDESVCTLADTRQGRGRGVWVAICSVAGWSSLCRESLPGSGSVLSLGGWWWLGFVEIEIQPKCIQFVWADDLTELLYKT